MGLSSLTTDSLAPPTPELHEGVVNENATGLGQKVRCTIPSQTPLQTTDPMSWVPYVTIAGIFYPKRGDRAVPGFPVDGPPVILWWQPKAAKPDVPFPPDED